MGWRTNTSASAWQGDTGLAVAWKNLDLTGWSATDDVNAIQGADFAVSSGDLTATIDASTLVTDGFREGMVKRCTLATLASLLGVTSSSLTDGSKIVLAKIKFNAELPRYLNFAMGFTDSAAQASMDGRLAGLARNAAADNSFPVTIENTLDNLGADTFARDSSSLYILALRGDTNNTNREIWATSYGVVDTTGNADVTNRSVWEKAHDSVDVIPTRFCIYVGANASSGGAAESINFNIQLAAVDANIWPLGLGAL
jgi:hypothetical protein